MTSYPHLKNGGSGLKKTPLLHISAHLISMQLKIYSTPKPSAQIADLRLGTKENHNKCSPTYKVHRKDSLYIFVLAGHPPEQQTLKTLYIKGWKMNADVDKKLAFPLNAAITTLQHDDGINVSWAGGSFRINSSMGRWCSGGIWQK